MKLTATPAAQLADVLCRLSGPLCAMLGDPKMTPILTRLTAPDLPLPKAGAILMGELLPLILRDHEADFFASISILADTPEDALRALTGPELIRLIRQIWDEELSAFFASAGIAHEAKSSAR